MPSPLSSAPAPVPGSASQHLVAMRDGVRLATDVYLPTGTALDGSARLPAVLTRLPYDKNGDYVFMETVAASFTAAGYAMVVQDVRGKFRSEGAPAGPVNEAADGYDTIEWITRQGWSDGVVGMFGDSYYGFTQWAALSTNHPALRAIVPRVTTARLGTLDLDDDGITRDIDWLTIDIYLAQCWAGKYINEEIPDLGAPPLAAAFESLFERIGERSIWYDLMRPRKLPAPVYPFGHPFDAKPIPVMHTVGWFDNLHVWSMRDYTELAGRPQWAPLTYLHADSTDHENYHLDDTPVTVETDHALDPGALQDMMRVYTAPAIEFFDVFLRGTAPVDSIPKVRWHLGHVGYRNASSWPPPGAVPTSLHLGGFDAVRAGRRGALEAAPPESEASCTWRYDPDALVPSAAINSFAFLLEFPDERASDDRPDVISFVGAPSEHPLDLAGPVDLHVRVSSTAPTADVHAKLFDVEPGGAEHVIAKGQTEILRPDGATLARVELGHAGYRLRPGHRLRLQLTSTDYPEYPPNSGTTEDRWAAAVRAGSDQTLLTGPVQPSRLVVHVLPPGSVDES